MTILSRSPPDRTFRTSKASKSADRQIYAVQILKRQSTNAEEKPDRPSPNFNALEYVYRQILCCAVT